MPEKRFSGLLLDELLPDGRESGEVFIDNNSIVFSNETLKKIISARDVIVEHGGTAKRQIYFKSRNESFTICCFDTAILNDPILKQNNQSSITKIKTRKSLWVGALVIVGVIILSPIVGALVFKKQIMHAMANQVPASIEQTLGEQFIKQVALTETLDSTSATVKELRKKAELISAQTGTDQKFNIYISNSEQVNAYALPGGYVVFNKGLLKKSKNWEEVLGVMGHEMAHVTQKHHARGMISKVGWVTVLSFFLGDGGAFTDLLFTTAANLEGLSYSRDFETESDEKALEYLTKAKIRPSGLVSFFETLQKESGIASQIPELLSTHPASDNRAKNLQNKIDKMPKQDYLDLEDY